MMRRILFLLCSVAVAAPLFAYGPTGHEIVGGIADKCLAHTPTAAKIAKLLDGMSLERAATVPDDIKSWDKKGAGDMSAYPHFPQQPRIEQQLREFWKANPPTDDPNSAVPSHHWFHYTDVPIADAENYSDGKTGRSQWDIVHMMRYCVQVLRGQIPENNPRKITKPVAIILLAHYVGDIHQPLHVGAEYFDQAGRAVDPDRGQAGMADEGGNSLKLELNDNGSSGHRPLKLHGFWDNDAVLAMFNSLPAGLTRKEQVAQLEAPKQQLIQQLAAQEPRNWRLPANIDPANYGEAWANEILPIARQAHERLRFSGVHAALDGNRSIAEGVAREQPMADRLSYRDWAAGVVRNELHKAGWRLADLLQKSLANSPSVAAVATSTPMPAPPVVATSTPVPAPVITPVPAAASAVPAPAATITPRPPTPTPPRAPIDPVYGDYPYHYKDIVMDWLYMHLHDPPSAKIEFQTEPRRADLPDAQGRKLYGYLVLFSVNAKNQFGTFTGKQNHGILIHDDEVIKATGFGYNNRMRPK